MEPVALAFFFNHFYTSFMLQIVYSPWLFRCAIMAPPIANYPQANLQNTLAFMAKGVYLYDKD